MVVVENSQCGPGVTARRVIIPREGNFNDRTDEGCSKIVLGAGSHRWFTVCSLRK